MKEKENKILFQDNDGNEIEFIILEQTTLGGTNYLLVGDSQDEDMVLIMRETALDDTYVSYEVVEDEEELKMISAIFNELVEDFKVSL